MAATVVPVWTPELWLPDRGWLPKIDLKRPSLTSPARRYAEARARARAKEDAAVATITFAGNSAGGVTLAGTTTRAITISHAQTTSSYLIVALAVLSGTNPGFTVSTFGGQTWTVLLNAATGGGAQWISIYALQAPDITTTTVTVNCTQTTLNWGYLFIEVASGITVSPATGDGSAVSAAAATTPQPTASFSTTNANDLLLGVQLATANTSWGTPGTGWTSMTAHVVNTPYMAMDYKEVTSTGSQSYPGRVNGTNSGASSVAALKQNPPFSRTGLPRFRTAAGASVAVQVAATR